MKRYLVFFAPIVLALSSCGKRNALTISSPDGSCVMYVEEKERIPKTGKYGGWLFSDSEPDWQATHIHFRTKKRHLKLPLRIINRIAEPHTLRLSVSYPSSGETIIQIHRDNIASGFDLLELHYEKESIIKATAMAIDGDKPILIYP